MLSFLVSPKTLGLLLVLCAGWYHLFTFFFHSVFKHPLITSPSPHLSRSLARCWGTTVAFTTHFPHSSRFSAVRSMTLQSRPVHSLMLSSHRFLCLPLRFPPCTVPCRIVLASPDDQCLSKGDNGQ